MREQDVTARDASSDGVTSDPRLEPQARGRWAAWVWDHARAVNRAISLLVAALLLLAGRQWFDRAIELNSPCVSVGLEPGVCTEVPDFLQGLQLVVALFGSAVIVVAAVLSVGQAFLNRRLPALGVATTILFGTAILWLGIYAFGRIAF